jgi:hypothetical protein
MQNGPAPSKPATGRPDGHRGNSDEILAFMFEVHVDNASCPLVFDGRAYIVPRALPASQNPPRS